LLEVTDFFVLLQREGWVNLQRPALIPAKLNAWLFYLYDAFAVNAIDKVKQFILRSSFETIKFSQTTIEFFCVEVAIWEIDNSDFRPRLLCSFKRFKYWRD